MPSQDPLSKQLGKAFQPATTDKPVGAGFDFTDPHSPLAPFYFKVSHVIAVAFLGLLFVLLSLLAMWHTDIWGHLAFGRWMVEHGRLVDQEPFSPFSDPTVTDRLHAYWLGQTGLYLTYHLGEVLAGGDALQRTAGGVEMLVLLQALLRVLVCALALAAIYRVSGSLPLSLVGLVLMLLASLGHMCVLRPRLLAEVCFAFVLLALSRPVLSKVALVLIPIVMVIWANMHGAYPIGIVLMGGVLAGKVIESSWAARSWHPRFAWADLQVRRLLALILICVVAMAALNPSGPFIYWNTLHFAQHPNVATMDEWNPVDFSKWNDWGAVQPYLAALALIALTLVFSPRWPTPTQIILLVGFGILPAMHQRMFVWYVLIVPWALVPHWAAIAKRVTWLSDHSVPSFRKTALAGLLVALAVVWSGPYGWVVGGEPRPIAQIVHTGTPWKLAAELNAGYDRQGQWLPEVSKELQRLYPQGRFSGTIFSTETLGDYLIWSLPSRIPVTMYSHVHLFTANHWNGCRHVKDGTAYWRAILDHYRVNLVVMEPEIHKRLCSLLHLDPAWLVVLDETGAENSQGERGRLLIALRQQPIRPRPKERGAQNSERGTRSTPQNSALCVP